jgi:hypothetical protein
MSSSSEYKLNQPKNISDWTDTSFCSYNIPNQYILFQFYHMNASVTGYRIRINNQSKRPLGWILEGSFNNMD